MLNEGASFDDIGKKIDRSAAAVEAKLKEKSTPSGSARASLPKSQSKPTNESAPTAQETRRAAPKSAAQSETLEKATPQTVPSTNDADEGGSSTMKYIIGAVIVAVVLWVVVN
jgi:hypothetical protein